MAAALLCAGRRLVWTPRTARNNGLETGEMRRAVVSIRPIPILNSHKRCFDKNSLSPRHGPYRLRLLSDVVYHMVPIRIEGPAFL